MEVIEYEENEDGCDEANLYLGVARVMRFLSEAKGKHAVVDGEAPSTIDLENILNAAYRKGWEMINIVQNSTGTFWKIVFRKRRI